MFCILSRIYAIIHLLGTIIILLQVVMCLVLTSGFGIKCFLRKSLGHAGRNSWYNLLIPYYLVVTA